MQQEFYKNIYKRRRNLQELTRLYLCLHSAAVGVHQFREAIHITEYQGRRNDRWKFAKRIPGESSDDLEGVREVWSVVTGPGSTSGQLPFFL